MLPLKLEVPANMLGMSDTLEVFQLSRSWLKASASLNMLDIWVTCETFQPEMLPLKLEA